MNGRHYRCVVTSGGEQVTSEEAVVIYAEEEALEITKQPGDVTAAAGEEHGREDMEELRIRRLQHGYDAFCDEGILQRKTVPLQRHKWHYERYIGSRSADIRETRHRDR